MLQNQLQAYVETDCIAVFAVACRYGWANMAKAAAKQSLKIDFRSFWETNCTSQLRHISADRFQWLLKYHRACGEAAAGPGNILSRLDAQNLWMRCTSCPASPSQWVLGQRVAQSPRAWISNYLSEAGAVLKDKPKGNVQNPVLLFTAQAKAAACDGPCRESGFCDLARWITEKYEPAVNAAIGALRLLAFYLETLCRHERYVTYDIEFNEFGFGPVPQP
ncbi:hypothetical protein K438DRAFT_1038208 [Mycena galopus ATCC 62051]|nr:hypothetical protein K438DRAFT_1038208 [Mycena galopus ATCC 62051]